MADQWKAKVVTVAGEPVAVVEVTLKRTLLITPQIFERIRQTLLNGDGDHHEPSGLTAVVDFYEQVKRLPTSTLPFIVVPWTDADNQEIGTRSFSQIAALLENQTSLRLEGSALEGFRAYLTIANQDILIDMSESAIPRLLSELDLEKAVAKAAIDKGDITAKEGAAVIGVCEKFGELSRQCEKAFRDHARAVAERDAAKRQAMEKAAQDHETHMKSEAGMVGDFPAGFGGDFKGHA